MKTIMVRYTTTKASAEANAALVRAVFAALHASNPGGIRYATYRVGDQPTFVHLATLASPDANPLSALPAFKAFQADLKSRCVDPPVVTELSLVGSY